MHIQLYFRLGDPNGIRTRATAVKGRRPRPLNDGAEMNPWLIARRSRLPTLEHTQSLPKPPIEGASPWKTARDGRTMEVQPPIWRTAVSVQATLAPVTHVASVNRVVPIWGGTRGARRRARGLRLRAQSPRASSPLALDQPPHGARPRRHRCRRRSPLSPGPFSRRRSPPTTPRGTTCRLRGRTRRRRRRKSSGSRDSSQV